MALAAPKQAPESLALRRAVANLLRIASTALNDAQLLLGTGHHGGAAILARYAFAQLITAVAAGEHGWPLDDWNTGLRAVPEANPFQPQLIELSALVDADKASAVQTDGRPSPPPETRPLAQSIDQVATTLDAVAKVFKTDLTGTGPAGHVAPIRPEPVREARAPKPSVPAAGRRGRKWQAFPDQATPAADGRTQEPVPAPAVKGAAPTTKPATAPPPDAPVHRPQPLHAAHHGTPDVSSTAFWSLMDRWGISDVAALALIGHKGGLAKKGTRPRFKVTGLEADLLNHLQEIDAALAPLPIEPAKWMRQPIGEAPFEGATPLAHMTHNSLIGARDVIHKIMVMGLRQRL